jgi:hypothetical protein
MKEEYAPMLERSSKELQSTIHLSLESSCLPMAISNEPEYPPLLGPGFHGMNLSALRALCVTAFPTSSTRERIMGGLEAVLTALHQAAIPAEAWIDGSFLTQKVDPQDSDIVIKLDTAFVETCTPDQLALVDAIAGSQMYKSHHCHSFSFVAYPDGHAEFGVSQWMNAYWIRQFGFSRDLQMKGIVLVGTPFVS